MKRAFAIVVALLAGAMVVLHGHDLARARDARRELDALGDVASCRRYSGLPRGFGSDARAGMVKITGGSFTPGSNAGYPEERPGKHPRRVVVGDFYIDRTEVTNAQFARFVAATGYVTTAERAGESARFAPGAEGDRGSAHMSWWRAGPGVTWRTPDGAGSDLRGRANQPVVHVSHADARAYARWLGRTLPSEDQWEYAARFGSSEEELERAPVAHGRPYANFWQGEFPDENRSEDGFAGTAPVGCYAHGRSGLHDMIGNVWEWTADDYLPRSERAPAGDRDTSVAAGRCHGGESSNAKVIKGGSFLCAPSFCARYRASARHAHDPTVTTAHIGFRTVLVPR